jgi:hypothetical protein
MKMDDTLNLIVVVHQADISANSHIPMVVWWRRQIALQVVGDWMYFLTQVLIQHGTLPQARFLIGVEPILVPESSGRIVLVLVVPVSGRLTILVIKLCVTLAILAAGAHHEHCRRADSYQQVSFHNYLLWGSECDEGIDPFLKSILLGRSATFPSCALVVLLKHFVLWLVNHSVVRIDLHIARLGFRNLGDGWAGIFADNVFGR